MAPQTELPQESQCLVRLRITSYERVERTDSVLEALPPLLSAFTQRKVYLRGYPQWHAVRGATLGMHAIRPLRKSV